MPHAKPKFGGGLAVSVDVRHEMAQQMILWMKNDIILRLMADWTRGARHFTDSYQTRDMPHELDVQ